jgi:LTXXQ motif family protein
LAYLGAAEIAELKGAPLFQTAKSKIAKHNPRKGGSDMAGKFVVSLVAASLIFTSAAFAQPPPAEPQAPPRGQPGTMMGPGMMGHGDWAPWMMGTGRHHGMMMAPGMIQAFAEGKLAFLKSWLNITEAQSGTWTAFADVVRAQAKSIAESRQKRMPTPDQPAELTLPQWVDQHLQMMDEHLAAMKKVKPALDALYQALTPEQRQKADQLIRMH